jgi:UDP-GlcNAc3NAcA epimerase
MTPRGSNAFTVISVVGARPQFVKAAVVSRALSARSESREVMVHTGQHFDAEMSAQFFDELGLDEPHHHLGISGGGHGEMTGRMLVELERVLLSRGPDIVVVYGDTNSTLAGALAAAKIAIPVAHVEAGLRSFNRSMPEEINRVVTDHLSSLLLCPTATAAANLKNEGIRTGVHVVGDVMYDAALHAAARAKSSTIRKRLGVEGLPYAVATVHRAENTDDRDRLAAIVAFLDAQAQSGPVVLPLHPRTKRALERFRLGFRSVRICPPLGHVDMTALVMGATRVFTDSGGLQKEAYFFRVPCITLRDETEWVETIDAGWNRLWRAPDRERARREIGEYGDGRAADEVVNLIVEFLRQQDDRGTAGE